MGNINSQSWQWCWGKTDRDGASAQAGGPSWNPLIAHLLDTAAVTLELWDRYLPAPIRRRLADGFGGGDEATARTVVAFLAALHDVGKASPAFAGRFGSDRRATARMREERVRWERQARAAGLPLPESWAGVPEARHEHITALELPRLLGCRCPGTGDGTQCTSAEHERLYDAAACLGGHHGHIPTPNDVKLAHGAAGGPAWSAMRASLVEVVAEQLGVSVDHMPKWVRPARPATLVVFTGLVVLSDWIASDNRRFPYAAPTDDPSTLWRRSGHRAREAITALGLDRWRPKTAVDWGDLWPETKPRRFQEDAMRLLPDEGQALVLVESDTGSGKTRLALWCAHHLALRNGYQGAYLAMPTRAATHQMALEVERFLPGAVDADTVNLALVHGAAGATELVHRLVDAVRVPGGSSATEDEAVAGHDVEDLAASVRQVLDAPDCEAREETGERQGLARAVLDPWYLRRCLGLIATFGIGTVDQIILSAQPSRHWFLRTFGLACKTVVIDEAHAYELYQQELLGAAVEWLADAGASVVVLSATLPTAVREALTGAWCTGLRVAANDSGQQGPITVVDGTGRVRRGGPRPDEVPPLRTAMSLDVDPGPQELAARLLALAGDSGCVGVVRNRVDEAVALYEETRAQAERYGWQPEEILLLHGRKLPRQRQPMEERLTSLLGPAADPELRRAGKPNPDRPRRLLVIATQVIEQSLDLDFDHLVSDLAPIDLLIQRRGRLHRHCANDAQRPAWCSETPPAGDPPAARMTVLHHPDPRTDGPPLVEPSPAPGAPGNADGFIYAPYVLAATYRALTARRGPNGDIGLSTPQDSPHLLEAVYGPRQTSDGAWGALLDRTWQAWQTALGKAETHAQDRALRPYRGARRIPVEVWDLASGRDHGRGDEGGLPELRAVSRLGDPSVSVLCLYRQAEDRLTYDAAGNLPLRLGAENGTGARRRQDHDLLLNTLSVPAHWFKGSRSLPATDTWPTVHPLLSRTHVALFDAQGACVSGPTGRIHYDPTTGLTRK
ncbi:CRISPR-associated helicase Cas3' [Streptomyces sp. NPDC048272]|uniref:CRISPR-associated helicase Cas3' n=1 Tax=Streptomyces sp. NPDC048272 TaxID=3154616 RepID=UPI0034436E66